MFLAKASEDNVIAEVTYVPTEEVITVEAKYEEVNDYFVIEPQEEVIAEEETVATTEVEVMEETFVEETLLEETSAEETFTEEIFVEETFIPEEVCETEECTEPAEEIPDNMDEIAVKKDELHTGMLTARKGYITDGPAGPNGNDGYETWYDLDMKGVVDIMRGLGYSEEEYPYWVREDGCKMFGPYIMVAGDIVNTRKRGDIVETSLGTAMVCDYCEYAVKWRQYQLDIATDWVKTYRYRN